MSIPADHDESNVIYLSFPVRAIPPSPPEPLPFILEAKSGRWKIHHIGPELDAAYMLEAADLLRNIARSLTEKAQQAAGQTVERCIAEFVLYETGGIDHWVSGDADRNRLRLGLRTAISTIREP